MSNLKFSWDTEHDFITCNYKYEYHELVIMMHHSITLKLNNHKKETNEVSVFFKHILFFRFQIPHPMTSVICLHFIPAQICSCHKFRSIGMYAH